MDDDTGTGRSDDPFETEVDAGTDDGTGFDGGDDPFADDTDDWGTDDTTVDPDATATTGDDPLGDLGGAEDTTVDADSTGTTVDPDPAGDPFADVGGDDPMDDAADEPDDGPDEPYTGAPSTSTDVEVGSLGGSGSHDARTAAPGGYDAETGEHVVPGDDDTDEATDDDVADAVDDTGGAGAAGMDALGRGREAMEEAAEELETGDTYTIHPSEDGDVNFANVEGESGEPVVIAQGDSNAAYSSDGDATAGGVNVKDSHHVNAGVELQDSEVYTEAVDELADEDEALEALFEYAAALDPASDAYDDMTLENGSDVYDEMQAAVDELDPEHVADGYDLGGTELKAVGDLLGTYADRLDAAADTSEADALAEDARDLAGKYQAAAEFAG